MIWYWRGGAPNVKNPGDHRGQPGFSEFVECLLAALALQVVHRIDRHRVVSDAVEVVHGVPFQSLCETLNQYLNVLMWFLTI